MRKLRELDLYRFYPSLVETFSPYHLTLLLFIKWLLDELIHVIHQLPHIGAYLPKTWVQVRERLETDTRDYISLEEFLDICTQRGFSRNEDKLQLSSYLHDLGVCLHFQDDALLRKTVILNPQWGTDAVYRVLDNPQVIQNLGRFTRIDLVKIWHEPKYADMHAELLQLMMNFKLCYQIPDSNIYIAPQLLSDNQPDYEWDELENLLLRYSYEFMPKGIVTRFIVQMHSFLASDNKVWKTGVILEKDSATAEVIEYYGKRELQIRVSGSNKKQLLTIVMYELDRIHTSYKLLKYQKLIPCNCDRCKSDQDMYFHSYEVLQNALALGQREVQCQKSFKMVLITKLIDDVIDTILLNVESERQWDRNKTVVFNNATINEFVLQQSSEGDNLHQHAEMGINSMKKNTSEQEQIKSPWASGLFYLFTFATVIVLLAILSNTVSWFALPLILIAGIIFVPLIGVLQLYQDNRLKEKTFVDLLKLVLAQLPFIGRYIPEGGA